MLTECNPTLFEFAPVEGRQVVVAFDGGAIKQRMPVHCCWARPTGRSG